MKLKGEKELKAEKLYELLSEEVSIQFEYYIKTIQNSKIEELNLRDDIVELVIEQQPIKYNILKALLNADLTLKEIKVLIEIQSKQLNIIDTIYKRLTEIKDRINIFNEEEMQKFVLDSVYLLAEYTKVTESEDENN